MQIRFEPKQKNYPPEKKVITNIGEFAPFEERLLMPQEEPEGLRLIENGDFVDVNADAPAVEIVADPEEAISTGRTGKKSK